MSLLLAGQNNHKSLGTFNSNPLFGLIQTAQQEENTRLAFTNNHDRH